MSEPTPAKPQTARRDRWTKLAFFLATLAIVLGVWWYQRSPSVPGFRSTDLEGTLRQAAADGRKVVVFFRSKPPGEDDRFLSDSILIKNLKALEEGRFLRVVVGVENLQKFPERKKYRLRKLPTLLLLGPDGKELNRREGRVGEVEFRSGFLDCSRVETPQEKVSEPVL